MAEPRYSDQLKAKAISFDFEPTDPQTRFDEDTLDSYMDPETGQVSYRGEPGFVDQNAPPQPETPAAPVRKKAFFDKESGVIVHEDGTKAQMVYDKETHRKYFHDGVDFVPVPLTFQEEQAGGAATVVQGVLPGFGDEFLAAVSAPVSAAKAAFGAEDPDGDYYKELELARSLQTRYADENPIKSFGMQVAAGLPTAIATGGAAAGALGGVATAVPRAAPYIAPVVEGATTTMGRVGQAVTGGAAAGGVAGFGAGEGDLEHRLASSGTGAAFGALAAGVLQSLSPAAQALYRRLQTTPQFWDRIAGTLTVEGRQAVVRAGGDPDAVGQELADAFAAQMRLAADPRAALASAEAQAGLAVPVRLTTGMRTGNTREQMLESRALQGSAGDASQTTMREAHQNIRNDLNANLEAVRSSSSGGRPAITPNQGGAAAQQSLARSARESRERVNEAYDIARSSGDASIRRDVFDRLGFEVKRELSDFDPDAFPDTWRVVDRVFRYLRPGDVPRALSGADGEIAEQVAERGAQPLVSALFKARRELVKLQAKPGESAAATAAKRIIDRQLQQLDPAALSGNPQAISAWRSAIAEASRHGRQYESGTTGKILAREKFSDQLQVQADDVASKVLGKGALKDQPGLLRSLVELRTRLGAESDQWLDFKQEVVLRILDKARGNVISGQGLATNLENRTFAASAFAEAVSALNRERPGLMRFLFTPREMQILTNTARVGKMTVPAEGGKQLGSGSAIASMIQTTFPRFYRALQFTVDSPPVRGTLNAVSSGAVRNQAAGQLPQRTVSYGARNAVSSAVATRTAAGGEDEYDDKTDLGKSAQITSPYPLVGDAVGVAADVEGYMLPKGDKNHLELNAKNLGLTAAGLLPFIAGAALKSNAVGLPDTRPIMNMPPPPKNLTVGEVGKAFEGATLKANGAPLNPVKNPEDLKRVTKTAIVEARDQYKQADHGANWYDREITEAFRLSSEVVPRLKTDETARQLMTAMAAVTSNGNRAGANWQMATQLMEAYEKTGKIPTRSPVSDQIFGVRGHTIAFQLTALEKLVKEVGEKGAVEWLLTHHTVGELNAMQKRLGWKEGGVSGKANEKRVGAFIFGPKVGPFMLNINGIREVTVDSWMTRQWGRYTGMLTSGGQLDEQGLRSQPRDLGEHAAIKSMVNQVAKALGVQPQDAQALLWYYEQRLYRAAGVKSERSESFSDGARAELKRRGVETQGESSARGAGAAGPNDPPASTRRGFREDGTDARKASTAPKSIRQDIADRQRARDRRNKPFLDQWLRDAEADPGSLRRGESGAQLSDRTSARVEAEAERRELARAELKGKLGHKVSESEWSAMSTDMRAKVADKRYAKAGASVDGLTVRRGPIDNASSMSSSMDDYDELPGLREVPFADFNGPALLTERTRKLVADIKASGEISPLIVVVDKKGPYILEGSHRYDALQHSGKKTFPALVVIDRD